MRHRAGRIDEGVDRRQLQIFVSLLLAYAANGANPNKSCSRCPKKLNDGGVSNVRVEPARGPKRTSKRKSGQKECKQHVRALRRAVTKERIKQHCMGRRHAEKVKRAVAGDRDQVLKMKESLVGWTTLRGLGRVHVHAFGQRLHIFGALGSKLRTDQAQAHPDLAWSALFHDVGKFGGPPRY